MGTAYGYIYKTTNLINGKIYIGQHRVANENDNDDYLGSGKLIRRAVKLYGKDNFKKEIIAYCNSLDELNQLEEEYIKMYNSTNHTIGYNISKGGGFMKCVGENNPFYGKHHTDAVKKKLSECRKNNVGPNLGRQWSDEYKQKMSLAKLGKSNGCEGREFSLESKIKMSNTKKATCKHRGRLSEDELKKLKQPKSEETKRRMVEGRKELDFIRKFLKEQGIASDKNHLSANLARAIYYEKYAIKEVML